MSIQDNFFTDRPESELKALAIAHEKALSKSRPCPESTKIWTIKPGQIVAWRKVVSGNRSYTSTNVLCGRVDECTFNGLEQPIYLVDVHWKITQESSGWIYNTTKQHIGNNPQKPFVSLIDEHAHWRPADLVRDTTELTLSQFMQNKGVPIGGTQTLHPKRTHVSITPQESKNEIKDLYWNTTGSKVDRIIKIATQLNQDWFQVADNLAKAGVLIPEKVRAVLYNRYKKTMES